MATINELDTKKISALTRKTVSGALDYLDYMVFNDASEGDLATNAVTIDALDSYFKVNVGHIGRTALSGDSSVDYGVMPHIQAVTLSAANMRSTATFTANNLTGTKVSAVGLCGDASYIKSTLTATTVSAENIHAANLSGILESQVKTDINQQGGSSSFGHVTIEGDLRVHGATVTTSASNLSVRDPIIEVAKDQTAPEADFGLLGNRGSAQNSAVIYDESADEWAVIYTTDDATTSGNITIASYADFQAKDATFNSTTITQGGNITNLDASNLSTGSVPDARVPASNVTQHEAALTILKSQVTDFDYFARTAVSGSDMFRLNATTVSASNIRSTAGGIFNTLTAETLQTKAIDMEGTVSATNLHADNSISGTTLSGKNISATTLYGDGSNITDLNATQITSGQIPSTDRIPSLATSKITSGTFADARISQSNVTQHEAALTILKSQVTDFNDFARTAVSGSNMFSLTANSVTADNLRVRAGGIFNTLTAATLQTSTIDTVGNLSATNVHADNSISGTTLSGKNISGEVMVDTANVFVSDSVYIGGRTSTNQLDNYVEGTFTPTISLGSGSVGYDTQDGYYTRIGNLIYCTVKIVLNAATSPAGAVTLAGFPVQTANHTGGAGVGALAASNLNFETSRSELPSNSNLSVKMVPNGTTAKIIYTDSEATMFEATGVSINSDTTLQFSVFYQAS